PKLAKTYGSVQAYTNSIYPMPPLRQLIRTAMASNPQMPRIIVPAAIMYLLWPWLTLFSLLIFRISLRQAQILPVHVVRCVVYSSDMGLIIAPAALALALWDPWRDWWITNLSIPAGWGPFDSSPLATLMLALALVCYP